MNWIVFPSNKADTLEEQSKPTRGGFSGASSTAPSPKTLGKIMLSPLPLGNGDVRNPVATSFDIPSTYSTSQLCDALEGNINGEVDGLDWRAKSMPDTTGVDEMTRWSTTVARINDGQGDLHLASNDLQPHAGDNDVCCKGDSEKAIYGSDESEPGQGAYPRPLAGFAAHEVSNNRASSSWQRLRGIVKDHQELFHFVGTTSSVQEDKDGGEQSHVLERVAPNGGYTDGHDGHGGHGDNGGQDRTGMTCVNSWRQREKDEAKAKEEAKLAQVKRAERVREVRNAGHREGPPCEIHRRA